MKCKKKPRISSYNYHFFLPTLIGSETCVASRSTPNDVEQRSFNPILNKGKYLNWSILNNKYNNNKNRLTLENNSKPKKKKNQESRMRSLSLFNGDF